MTSATVEAVPDKLFTGPEALALGDIGPYELIEGRITRMSPTKHVHGNYEVNFATILNNFVRPRKLGQVQGGEVGVYIHRNPDTVRAADVLFISNERLAKAAPDDFLDVPPELIVEVVSPNDTWTEIRKKVKEYLGVGVNVVLVIEPDEHTLTVFRSLSNVLELTAADTLTLEDILPGFSLPLSEFFS